MTGLFGGECSRQGSPVVDQEGFPVIAYVYADEVKQELGVFLLIGFDYFDTVGPLDCSVEGVDDPLFLCV